MGVPSMIVISARVAVTALMLGLAACTYRPGADNPVARNLTWFSYAGAGDIRADCRPGAADRMRLIYNGDYDEQVRRGFGLGVTPYTIWPLRLRLPLFGVIKLDHVSD